MNDMSISTELLCSTIPKTVSIEGEAYHKWSRLSAILRDAREAIGRDPESGAEITEVYPRLIWLSALGYLLWLEALPDFFEHEENSCPMRNYNLRSIESAAQWALGISRKEASALYALRCAFAHGYKLTNTQANNSRRHVFLVDRHEKLVRLPDKKVSRSIRPKSLHEYTKISLTALSKACEEANSMIPITLKEGKLLKLKTPLPPDSFYYSKVQ